MKYLYKTTFFSIALLCGMFLFFMQSHAQDAPDLNDPQIASAVVVANQIDVDYGKIALEKSENDEVKHFAQTMINDHQSIIEAAVALAEKLGVTPDNENELTQSLSDGEKEMIAKLKKAKKGQEFDKVYIDNEVAYHEAVIGAVKEVLIPQADNEELKQTMVDVSPLLDHHLEMAKEAQAHLK